MRQMAGLLWLLLLIPSASFAETVQAFVDRTATTMDAPITLTVDVSGRDASVDTSVIRDFDVQPAGTSTQVQIVNGRTSEKQSHQFLLVPKRIGLLTIPALSVRLEKRVYQTQPIDVQVTGEKDGSGEGSGRDIEVRAQVSETAPYIGQQLVYTFVLRYGIQIANTQYTAPDFSGFTAKQIGETQSRQTVIDGRRYQEVGLSYLLIPMKTGPLTIGPAMLRCDAVSQQRRRSDPMGRLFNDPFFSDSFFGTRQVTPRILRTEPITLEIQSLPPETEQAPFMGLVGSFAVSVSIDPIQIKVGDSATLVATVEGTGNIMDANTPVIQVPDAFKQYADAPESDIELGQNGYQGKKVFRFALVAVSPGNYQVGLAPGTYFDPKEKAYRPLNVSPLSLIVGHADSPREDPVVFSSSEESGALPGIIKKKVDFVGRDILPIKPGLDAVESEKELSSLVLVTVLALPALLFLLGMGSLKLREKNGNPASQMMQKARFSLKTAQKTKGASGTAFLSHIYRSLVYGICAKANTCGESLTYEEVGRILLEAGISARQSDRVTDLMKKIDSARYSGFSLDEAEKDGLLRETTQLMKEVLR